MTCCSITSEFNRSRILNFDQAYKISLPVVCFLKALLANMIEISIEFHSWLWETHP